MFKVAGVDPEHSLRNLFICALGAKMAIGHLDLGCGKALTYLHSKKKQDIYGTEELKFKFIFR